MTLYMRSSRVIPHNDINYIHNIVGSQPIKPGAPSRSQQCDMFLQFSSVKVQSAQVKCSQEQSIQ